MAAWVDEGHFVGVVVCGEGVLFSMFCGLVGMLCGPPSIQGSRFNSGLFYGWKICSLEGKIQRHDGDGGIWM